MQLKDGTIFLLDIHQSIACSLSSTHMSICEYHLPHNYNNKDTFDILTHHVLHDICNHIIENLKYGQKTILYFCNTGVAEYWELPDSPDFQKAVTRIEKIVKRVIPAYIIETDIDKIEFIQRFKANEAWAVDHMDTAIAKFDKNAFKPFNLNKLIRYLKHRGLKYLSDDYFQQANNKLLAANK